MVSVIRLSCIPSTLFCAALGKNQHLSKTSPLRRRAALLRKNGTRRCKSSRKAHLPQSASGCSCCKKYAGGQTDSDDLLSIGTIGLIKAVSSFSFRKGTRFATFAAKCIENAILSQRNNRRLRWKTMNLLGQNGLCSAA